MTSSDDKNKNKENGDAGITRDVRSRQKFSIAGAIGREGGTIIKGTSPVPKLLQVVTKINSFIREHLSDTSGSLRAVLQTKVKHDHVRISRHLDAPLGALAEIIEEYLNNEEHLRELVREVDFKWGQMNLERPHFEEAGSPPDPEDEYTFESVRRQLEELLRSAKS